MLSRAWQYQSRSPLQSYPAPRVPVHLQWQRGTGQARDISMLYVGPWKDVTHSRKRSSRYGPQDQLGASPAHHGFAQSTGIVVLVYASRREIRDRDLRTQLLVLWAMPIVLPYEVEGQALCWMT